MTNIRLRIASACGWLAALCLAGMMLLTVADVLLRHLLDWPIRGVIEMVELLLTGAFFLALPAVFLREEHIVVDILDYRLPRAVPWLKRISAALAAITLAVMGWRGWIAAGDTLVFGDVTSDLSWPKIWYWVPVLAGIIGGGIAAFAMLFVRQRKR